MNPFRVLVFLLAVILSLSIVSIFFPVGGIKIGSQITLEFPKVSEVLIAHKTNLPSVVPFELPDSVIAESDSSSVRRDSIPRQTLAKVFQPIETDVDAPNPLAPFYHQLISNKSIVRVFHYGDSQIEGDRITGYLRQKFQARFGGSGVGYVPVVEPANVALSVALDRRGSWKRFTVYGKRDSSVHHNQFGAFGSFGRFFAEPNKPDTLSYNNSILFMPQPTSPKVFLGINSVKLLYGKALAPFSSRMVANGNEVYARENKGANDMVLEEFSIQPSGTFSLEFRAAISPDIYGVMLDGDSPGVAFDNIPMRGSSGTDFTRIDFASLQQNYSLLNVGMIIFQFGVNVVPNIQTDYTFYENWIFNQLIYLRKAKPNMPILVVGVSDMSMKSGESFISYPNLPKVIAAQRKAAFRAGCAFWDMYKAMGGENSMVAWVNAQPPLANQDYVHFNNAGARIISQYLYHAMISDFEKYLKTLNLHPGT